MAIHVNKRFSLPNSIQMVVYWIFSSLQKLIKWHWHFIFLWFLSFATWNSLRKKRDNSLVALTRGGNNAVNLNKFGREICQDWFRGKVGKVACVWGNNALGGHFVGMLKARWPKNRPELETGTVGTRNWKRNRNRRNRFSRTETGTVPFCYPFRIEKPLPQTNCQLKAGTAWAAPCTNRNRSETWFVFNFLNICPCKYKQFLFVTARASDCDHCPTSGVFQAAALVGLSEAKASVALTRSSLLPCSHEDTHLDTMQKQNSKLNRLACGIARQFRKKWPASFIRFYSGQQW